MAPNQTFFESCTMAIEVNGWVYEVSSNGQREMIVAFVRELFDEPITVLDDE